MAATESLVSLRQVSHVYNARTVLARPALEAVDMEVRPGTTVAVVGPTASGKSTLLEILAGLLVPTGGSVRRAAAAPGGAAAAMAFQRPEAQLFCSTVGEDVAVGPSCQGLSSTLVARRVDAALRVVGLDPERFGTQSPFALSVGEQRRVALAGVLAVEPALLVLDEVGAGLDARSRRSLMRRLETWKAGDSRRAVVFSTHDLEEAAEADLVMVLSRGRVVAEGSPAEVLGNDHALGRAGLEPPLAARVAIALGAEPGAGCPVTAGALRVWWRDRRARGLVREGGL